jgi:hypothetical protein
MERVKYLLATHLNMNIFGAIMLSAIVLALTPIEIQAKSKLPKLRSSEGYVLVSYAGNFPPVYLSVATRSVFPYSEDLGEFKTNVGYRLIVLEKGEYKFSRLKLTKKAGYYYLRDNEYDFEVKAGQINYSGQLNFEYLRSNSITTSVVNRITPAYQWLTANHPELASKYSLRYTGLGSDNFMDFYNDEKESLK